MPSPRATLLGHVAACLKRILKADGYNTDAGKWVTLEPAPADAGERPYITVVWLRQQRSDSPAKVRIARQTTVRIVAKVPSQLAKAQETLDAIAADIERAMADQSYRYPSGYDVPQYESTESVPDASPNGGWVGVVFTYTSHIPIQ